MTRNDPKSYSAEPFPASVNRDLRFYVAERKAPTAEREDLFGERDGLREQINELKIDGEDDSDEAKDLKGKYTDVVIAIEDKAIRIKWCTQEIGKLIEKADDRGLYDDKLGPLPEPPEELFEVKHRKPKHTEDDDQDDAGEPDAPGQKTTNADEKPLSAASFPGVFELHRVGKFRMPAKVDVPARTFEDLKVGIDRIVEACDEQVIGRVIDEDGWQVKVEFAGTGNRVVMEISRAGDIPEAVQPGEKVDPGTGEIRQDRKPRKRKGAAA